MPSETDLTPATLQRMCEAADEVDQIRATAKDLHLSRAEHFLALAWWMIEDEIRDATGACSNAVDHSEAKVCGTCREYFRLAAAAAARAWR